MWGYLIFVLVLAWFRALEAEESKEMFPIAVVTSLEKRRPEESISHPSRKLQGHQQELR